MKKIILRLSGAFLMLLLIVATLLVLFHHKKTTPAPTRISVKLMRVTAHNVPRLANATGHLLAEQNTTISAKESGYINKIAFKEGEPVTAGQTLVTLDHQTQQATLRAAQTALHNTQNEVVRDKKLLKKGFITHTELYTAETANQQNKTNVTLDQKNLDNTVITAPFSGTVGTQTLSLGDFVNPGTKITTLVDQQHLRVEYALPARYLPQLHLGAPVSLTTEALPGKTFTAQVSFIAPSVDPDTQTVTVHATLFNRNEQLKPGEFVHITQRVGQQNHVLLVPDTSVIAALNSYHVFGVKKGKAIEITLQPGAHIHNNVVVRTGLKVGDQIIVVGQDQLHNGTPVKVVRATP